MRNKLTLCGHAALWRIARPRYTDRSAVVAPSIAMPRLSLVVLSALLGATLALPAAAQWKWRDKGGHIQYSDLPPPPGVAEQDILQRPNGNQRRMAVATAAAPAPSAAASGPQKAGEPELEAKRRKAQEEAAAKRQAEEQKIAVGRGSSANSW